MKRLRIVKDGVKVKPSGCGGCPCMDDRCPRRKVVDELMRTVWELHQEVEELREGKEYYRQLADFVDHCARKTTDLDVLVRDMAIERLEHELAERKEMRHGTR